MHFVKVPCKYKLGDVVDRQNGTPGIVCAFIVYEDMLLYDLLEPDGTVQGGVPEDEIINHAGEDFSHEILLDANEVNDSLIKKSKNGLELHLQTPFLWGEMVSYDKGTKTGKIASIDIYSDGGTTIYTYGVWVDDTSVQPGVELYQLAKV